MSLPQMAALGSPWAFINRDGSDSDAGIVTAAGGPIVATIFQDFEDICVLFD